MPPKRNRNRQLTPAWLDSLIVLLEIVGFIGTILGGIYALVTFFLD
jgi:hypothetical protein